MNNPRTAQLTWASRAPVRAGFETPFWGFVYTPPGGDAPRARSTPFKSNSICFVGWA